MICPYKFSQLHRGGWILSIALYSMALICAVVGYETDESCKMIILCLQVYIGMIVVVELIAWWIRKWWMEGAFQRFTIDVLMASSKEEDARDIMYNMAVWPVMKRENKIHEMHAGALGVIMRLFYLGCGLAGLAVIFA